MTTFLYQLSFIHIPVTVSAQTRASIELPRCLLHMHVLHTYLVNHFTLSFYIIVTLELHTLLPPDALPTP